MEKLNKNNLSLEQWSEYIKRGYKFKENGEEFDDNDIIEVNKGPSIFAYHRILKDIFISFKYLFKTLLGIPEFLVKNIAKIIIFLFVIGFILCIIKCFV